MIELFLTAHIIYTINSSQMENCSQWGSNLDGCYVEETNNIYVNETTKSLKDFVLYHEIGHSLFKLNFPSNLFTDKEEMANQFAKYIYLQKYPKLGTLITGNRFWYFREFCGLPCVDEILKIDIPRSLED